MHASSIQEIDELDALIQGFFEEANERFPDILAKKGEPATISSCVRIEEPQQYAAAPVIRIDKAASKERERPRISRSALNHGARVTPLPFDPPKEGWKYSQASLPPEPCVPQPSDQRSAEQLCPRCGYRGPDFENLKRIHIPPRINNSVAPLKIVPTGMGTDQTFRAEKAKISRKVVKTNTLCTATSPRALVSTKNRGNHHEIYKHDNELSSSSALRNPQSQSTYPYLQSPLSLLAALALTPCTG